jgi:hypothetical protein
MKAAVLRMTAILAVVIAVTAVSVQAQGVGNRQTFAVPFDFSVGRTVLPAGEYTFSADNQAVRIQSKDGRSHAIALPQRTLGASHIQSDVRLTFRRYGDQYYLSQVWFQGGVGREFKKQRPANGDLAQNYSTIEVLSRAR